MKPEIRDVPTPGFARVLRVDLGSTVAFLAIHTTRGGRSFGGIRVRAYPSEDAACDDALDLARAMSRKLLLAELNGGGAKTVVVRPPDSTRAEVLARLGDVIESLDGAYHCGGDLGYTAADQAILQGRTSHVAPAGIGHHTAASVHAALTAVATPRAVSIQGLGDVGRPLAERLRDEGVAVTASDVRPFDGFDHVDPEAIYDVAADAFAPCAVGGVLTPDTAERLRVRVVCGGANNPLASDDVATQLARRGIVYVPDFVANVGAVAFGVCRADGMPDDAARHIAAVGPRAAEIVEAARETGRTPLDVALERADDAVRRLAD